MTGTTVVAMPEVQVELGIQGPPGPPGPPGGGTGVTFAQDTEPVSPDELNLWWNPLTLQLKVYRFGAWQPASPDGGYF
jgi:hypothetical protein